VQVAKTIHIQDNEWQETAVLAMHKHAKCLAIHTSDKRNIFFLGVFYTYVSADCMHACHLKVRLNVNMLPAAATQLMLARNHLALAPRTLSVCNSESPSIGINKEHERNFDFILGDLFLFNYFQLSLIPLQSPPNLNKV
jgi:hypothetical protein